MGFLSYIPIIGDLIDKGHDLASQAITDVDKRNEMVSTFEQLKTKVDEALYLAELNTKTIPAIDAVHKMGRLITQWAILLFVFICILLNHDITQFEAVLIGAPVGIYQLIKGKGQ